MIIVDTYIMNPVCTIKPNSGDCYVLFQPFADKGAQVNAGMVRIAVTIDNSSASCGQAINAYGVKGHKLF